MSILDNDTQVSVLVDGLDHPEGIAWGLDGYAYAGGEAGQLYRIDIEKREAVQLADTGGFVLGLALDANHNIYACDTGNSAVMKISQGRGRICLFERHRRRAVPRAELPRLRRRGQPVRVRVWRVAR